jgi:hypothetical protein
LEGAAKFIAILEPDLVEMNMARSDRMDEAIDRTIKRLMQVKTAKQVFPSVRKNAPADPKWITVVASVVEKEQNDKLPAKVEILAKPIANLRMVSDGPFLKIGQGKDKGLSHLSAFVRNDLAVVRQRPRRRPVPHCRPGGPRVEQSARLW